MRFLNVASWQVSSLFLAFSLTAVPAVAQQPATARQGDRETAERGGNEPALVEAPATEDLLRLDPDAPIWIDPKGKQVVIDGEVCLRQGTLEMFACPKQSKEHESVLSVPVRPMTVHAGLLAVGAFPGHPARWTPEFEAASGTTIELTVFWTDEDGKQRLARAQDWIREVKSGEAMKQSWVFGGSQQRRDPLSDDHAYGADSGDFICVSNFPDAMLDVQAESTSKSAELRFEAFTERIPPLGTKVTLVLTPKAGKVVGTRRMP
jgi:hypothetical protein